MFCMAVISLVYSHVIEVCVFSSLSSFCSLRPALGGMQIDMRFSFDLFAVILCLYSTLKCVMVRSPLCSQGLKLQLFMLCAFSMSMW